MTGRTPEIRGKRAVRAHATPKAECKKGDESAPASDSGRLRHGEAAHGRSDLQRRAFMLTTLFDGTTGGSRPSLRISYR